MLLPPRRRLSVASLRRRKPSRASPLFELNSARAFGALFESCSQLFSVDQPEPASLPDLRRLPHSVSDPHRQLPALHSLRVTRADLRSNQAPSSLGTYRESAKAPASAEGHLRRRERRLRVLSAPPSKTVLKARSRKGERLLSAAEAPPPSARACASEGVNKRAAVPRQLSTARVCWLGLFALGGASSEPLRGLRGAALEGKGARSFFLLPSASLFAPAHLIWKQHGDI